ncbi:chromosome segregation and condensation protein [Komagataeibacter diospyri]|uniref:Segregation and condensation protein A n=2 Tax=Komagataeibacter diospyri TaxID=1932662 RepID=A0A4P5NTM3_9PROT|nr:chromosome segregation and condensation protein [Komagataeibacter diospyri]
MCPDSNHDGEMSAQPVPQTSAPEFHVVGFDGPLDLLLDLAERQRIDLGMISVAMLAEQFVVEADRLARTTPLMKRAHWLIWVARLMFLRSRLLFASQVERRDAEKEAHRIVAHLDELLRIRAAATWLEERPQLGVTTFARGCSALTDAPRGRQVPYFGLMEACLGVLERELARFEERDPIYAIAVPAYWTITDRGDVVDGPRTKCARMKSSPSATHGAMCGRP